MDEKTPHLHLTLVPLTKDNRLCAKEIIGSRANLTKWQDDFHAYMVEKYPDLERGERSAQVISWESAAERIGELLESGQFASNVELAEEMCIRDSYYYHLVEKAFDTIREKDSVSGKVIPEVVRYEE